VKISALLHCIFVFLLLFALKFIAGDGIKKEHVDELDGTEEEVITSGIDADFTDYMSEQKLTLPGTLPGIDLSDPHQLASFAKCVFFIVYCSMPLLVE
jgi:hypothetical protein